VIYELGKCSELNEFIVVLLLSSIMPLSITVLSYLSPDEYFVKEIEKEAKREREHVFLEHREKSSYSHPLFCFSRNK